MTTGLPDRPAPVPLAAPAARPVAYLVTLALASIGAVAAHDWLVRMGAVDRPELVAGFVGWLDGHGWDNVLLPTSILGVLLGLALLVVAFRPRRRTHVRATGHSDMWLRPVDVGRIAARSARRCPGVFDATALAGARAVTVTVDAGGAADDGVLAGKIRDAVHADLATALDDVPPIKVRRVRATDGVDRRTPAKGRGRTGDDRSETAGGDR